MQVLVDGTSVALDKRSVLGSGGEGTVYKAKVKNQTVALKVYEKPTRARANKLIAFDGTPHNFTDRIIAPDLLAYDASGLVVGFTMPLINGTFTEISNFSNKKFRSSYGVTSRDVARVFLDGIPTLSNIHSHGFVVGDLNDLNVLSQATKMLWWDVDSWQFGKFACPVATETFLDPALYGIDLSLKPVFNIGNDWYSYAVMLFKSLLMVHPYGGIHKTFLGIPERATRHVTVLDRDVTYPVIGISPDILSDDMHNIFESYFKKGARTSFPEDKLREYTESLRQCTKCGSYFPSSRGTCPVCSAKMVILIQKPLLSNKDMEVFELLRVDGKILYLRVLGEEVRVMADIKGKTVLVTKKPKLPAYNKELFTTIPGAKFEMDCNSLYVNKPGENSILVYQITSAKLLGKIDTEMFALTRKAVFRASNVHLFRIDGNNLKYGKMNGGSFEETVLRRIMEDQTWFWVDHSSTEPYVFGLFQVIRQQVYWMIKDGNYYDVSVPQLADSEILLEVSAKFSSQGIYLIRKTQLNGKNYLRQEMVDVNGKVVFSNNQVASTHPNPEVHGQVYASGVVLHPTDKGVMQEKIATGETKVFSVTKGHVDGSDTLYRLENSILSVGQDRVIQITLK